jgi:hypothetical protein
MVAARKISDREAHDDSVFDDADALIALAKKSFARAAKEEVAKNDSLGIATHGSADGKLVGVHSTLIRHGSRVARWMWIIGGPNGGGKSSFAGRFLDDLGHRQLIKLNADERTLALRAAFPDVPLNDLNLRAAKGGHDVEAARAIERHGRSHDELRWFAPQADLLMVFDNSAKDGMPVLVASRANARPLKRRHPGLNPAVDAALSAAFPVRKPRQARPSPR